VAQWSHGSRTLFAKLVYYGPALGGKTTNLQELHRLLDPQATTNLLSVKTADDRTLFFDLLPFELGEIQGYRVALKLYTVPGQVRYDTTRRVVLAGADAVVFVADSSRARETENRGSLENLRINMRANRLDPATVPVLLQFNKQDVPDAATPEEVAGWLGADAASGFPAVAVHGEGVLETFVAATRRMLERLASLAGEKTRERFDAGEMVRQVERAFAPHLARLKGGTDRKPAAPPPPDGRGTPVVLGGKDLLEQSVRASLALGEQLAGQSVRADRLEREAEALRGLSDALRKIGPSFDRGVIVGSALSAAAGILGAAQVTLLRDRGLGDVETEGAFKESGDPLLACSEGRALVARFFKREVSSVVDDLAAELGVSSATSSLSGVRAGVAVPVEGDARRILVAYAPAPDGSFGGPDVRFLSTVAGHLAASLDKSRVHAELARHRDQLEEMVRLRTEALRKAFDDLRELDRMKDRFLSNLSHEMRSPVTAIVGAVTALREYGGPPELRAEMLDAILEGAHVLDGLLGSLFRLVRLESGADPLKVKDAAPEEIVAKAIELAGARDVAVQSAKGIGAVSVDAARVAQALANLLDNAVKFSPPGSQVAIRIVPARLRRGGDVFEGVAFSVLDRGPGIPPPERERVFAAFEQGGDLLTAKPKGVGLGLHEARFIARMHGGTLKWHERDEGGSEFRLLVPREPAGGAEPGEASVE
jgi:mutual gliding-motility protein MglA